MVLGYPGRRASRPAVGGAVTAEWEGAGVSVSNILWLVVVVIVILWLLGLVGSVGGSLIHLLLVLAVIVIIANLLMGRRSL